jgi:hypothetical protein
MGCSMTWTPIMVGLVDDPDADPGRAGLSF